MSSFSSNNRVFGQATRRPNGRMNSNSRYQRQMGQSVANQDEKMKEDEDLALRRIEMRKKKKEEGEALDERFGFVRYCSQNCGQVCDESRRGWIFNMLATVSSDLHKITLLFWKYVRNLENLNIDKFLFSFLIDNFNRQFQLLQMIPMVKT